MAALNPYLNFNGNCEEAFDFYQSVFGGELIGKMRFKDGPAEHTFSENEADKILNTALPIGKTSVLMGSDVPEAFGKAIIGTNTYVSIGTDSEEETERLFAGLSADGQVMMPLHKAFWGDYFGMFTDKFGIQWMVSYAYNRQG
ncbi:VOC family protein [Spirosoma sp. SC4-14]|uniref:VOC family protein n=1 Tax=Spirosoma sp. SC4-14 TaxID=3128900 RepID=UPI0030CF3FB7